LEKVLDELCAILNCAISVRLSPSDCLVEITGLVDRHMTCGRKEKSHKCLK
jgi:hypothetical protein